MIFCKIKIAGMKLANPVALEAPEMIQELFSS